MSELRVMTAQSEDLEPSQRAELLALCGAAFGEPFEETWDRVGPGLHVMGELGGRVVAHAMIVDRRLYFGHEADLALDVAYVEHVATAPALQGQGYGAATMRRAGGIIGEEYALGALSTSRNGFYERLGWETWAGPTSIRMPDGERLRSPSRDGQVMILRTPRTPSGLSIEAPAAVDWRSGDSW
ncbi:MAG: GNAT family N-acetyltransferase [Chloroflexi bacterium]|nr:GNAT family N-acetyltransferase [Chloroflexota bacterium]